MRWLLIQAIVSLLASPLLADSFVYVSLDGENRIAVYDLDTSGKLSKQFDIQTESPPGALCFSPDEEYLYASLRKAGMIASFRRDKKTGHLTHINTVAAGDDPAFVATDQTGRYLLSAYYVAAKVSVHGIDAGRISAKPIQSLPTAKNAHAILTDGENKLTFVPHTSPNAIYQFHFDADHGRLIPNSKPILQLATQTGPRQLAFHPTLDVVYFDYEQGSAIAAFDIDRKSGQLSFRERFSSLPANYDKPNSNARIEIAPNGRFIYVANRGHDSLAGFSIDPTTGNLTPFGQFSTEPTPRGFAIDSTSRFLVAAGQASDRVVSFEIHAQSGKLSRLDTQQVGSRPWWVSISR